MNIAVISPIDILHKVDGVTTYHSNISPYLQTSKHAIDYYIIHNKKHRPVKAKNLTYYFVHITSYSELYKENYLSFNPFQILRVYFHFYRMFKEKQYDAVQISASDPISFMAVMAARRLFIPTIGSYHTHIPEFAQEYVAHKTGSKVCGSFSFFAVRWWTNLVYKSTTHVIAPTIETIAVLQERGYKSVSLVSRGINKALFKPVSHTNKKPVALYTGRLSVEKNLQKLAFLKNTEAELHLVGEGFYRKELKKHLSFARFHGFLSGKKLAASYAKADVFVFPSLVDAFANCVLEAMASGLPVVIYSNARLNSRIEHGVSGFIAQNDAEFESYTKKLLNDEALRLKMGAQARKSALTYSWKKVAHEQLDAFDLAVELYKDNLKKFVPAAKQTLFQFNFQHAVWAAINNGLIVGFGNAAAGFYLALNAGLVQMVTSFFMKGVTTGLYEVLFHRGRWLAVFCASLFTSSIATGIHFLAGTPHLLITWSLIFFSALIHYSWISECHVRLKTIQPTELLKHFWSFTRSLFQK